jgi:8-oxo-dGTP pyrophosphatase MutT (NUDIX family)
METKSEVSAGGVVYRRTDVGDRAAMEICLAARRTRRGDLVWGLPKGAVEENESDEEAALREVREESGLEAEIEGDLGTIRYFYVWEGVRIRKQVHFFLMRATGGDLSHHDEEMEDVRWFAMGRAAKRAAYRGEREVVERAVERLSS